MDSQEQFFQKVRRIFKLIMIDLERDDIQIEEIHRDFAEAQKLIVIALIEIEKEKIEQNSLQKTARIAHSSDVKEHSHKIEILHFRECVIRRLADSIAWQLIHADHYTARRLFLGEIQPSLLSKGFGAVQTEVNLINDRNGIPFALITDITSFIQTGDILLKESVSKYSLIEIKTGVKNSVAISIANSSIKNEAATTEIDKNTLDQVQRILRQKKRLENATSTISNKKGLDNRTGLSVSLHRTNEVYSWYYKDIQSCMEDAQKKDWGYVHIDGILHLGAYKNQWRHHGFHIIKGLISEGTAKTYPVFHFSGNISSILSEPIFLKPLNEEFIFQVLSGEMRVYLGIDFDRVIDLFNELGTPHKTKAEWLSTKESAKVLQKTKKGDLLSFNNRVIRVSKEGVYCDLGSAFVTRITQDNASPISVIANMLDMIQQMSKDDVF